MIEWLNERIHALSQLFPEGSFFSFDFNIHGMLAVVLVSLVCGGVGSLVVGNRMAFFSDALAHCAFAGIALGLLLGLFLGISPRNNLYDAWGIPTIMVLFGILVGLGIAFVREKTALANDT